VPTSSRPTIQRIYVLRSVPCRARP
jgi:hypothetical protein